MASESSDRALRVAKSATKSVYERYAEDWDAARSRDLFEKPWLDRFAAATPPGGRVLDLGCGTGEPIAAYLLKRGRRVVGVDFAAPMIAIARRRFPESEWLLQDIRSLDVAGPFHGVISWDGFFHLSADEQRAALPSVARLVAPGGPLLLTVGPREGAVVGTVAGETVFHASLSEAAYRMILAKEGFADIQFEAESETARGRTILLARRV